MQWYVLGRVQHRAHKALHFGPHFFKALTQFIILAHVIFISWCGVIPFRWL